MIRDIALGALFVGILESESLLRMLKLTVEARKLEHDGPPTPNQRKKNCHHKSFYIHVQVFGIYFGMLKLRMLKLS